MSTIRVMLIGGPAAGRVFEVDSSKNTISVASRPKFDIAAIRDPDSLPFPRADHYFVRKFASQPGAALGPTFHYLATHDDRDMMAELIEVYGASKRIDARERWTGRVEGFDWALKLMRMEGATDTPAYGRMLMELEKLKQEAKCE